MDKPCRLIVAGSRSITDVCTSEEARDFVFAAVDMTPFEIKEIVSGTASGVDGIGELYASERDIPVERFPADWDTHGRAAGPIRNQKMAEYADAALIVRVNGSAGSTNMIETAKDRLGEEQTMVVDVSIPA